MADGPRRALTRVQRTEASATRRPQPSRPAAPSQTEGVRSLQRALGNRGVGAMLQGSQTQARTSVQRSPADVYTLVGSFQGRLRAGPGIDAAALQILSEISQFASKFTDPETRQELANRAGTILADWAADTDLSPATRKEAERILKPLMTVPPQPAAAPQPTATPAQKPTTPATAPNAAPKVVAKPATPPAAANGPATAAAPPPTAAATTVALTAAMRAVDVLNHIAAGRATASGLAVRWFESSLDKAGGYSTAYNLGKGSKWEIHVHRTKTGVPWTCTVQQAVAVGNTGATRGMELDWKKLDALGIPAKHDPRTLRKANAWGPV